jgi:hypothetical protein
MSGYGERMAEASAYGLTGADREAYANGIGIHDLIGEPELRCSICEHSCFVDETVWDKDDEPICINCQRDDGDDITGTQSNDGAVVSDADSGL